MQEVTDTPTAQHRSLGIVLLVAVVVFVLAIFFPSVLEIIFKWVPLFNRLAK